MTNTRNELMSTRSTSNRVDDHIDPKRPSKRNRPKQLQTNNVPTDDVENFSSINKEIDSLIVNKPRIVPWGIERMPQKIQRYRTTTLHWSAPPQRGQDETQKSVYGLDLLQKGIWYSHTNPENKLPQNVQNIRWNHRLYWENHENLESGINCRTEKLSWN